MTEIKKKLDLKGADPLILFGFNDANLKLIEKSFNSKVVVRGENIYIQGNSEDINKIENLFSELIFFVNRYNKLDKEDVETAIKISKKGKISNEVKKKVEDIILFTPGGYIKPRSEGQSHYYKSALENDIVFTIGPAGTGKTYLAVAIAINMLKNKAVKKIVLSRPAVEAGESLGFLPGDLREKVDPYLRPLYDALFDMLPAEKLSKYLEKRIIEVVPLAYMRGRTLNSSFVILDEAQNTTPLQMKMFLTRLGVNSKAIITGDITQIDLPNPSQSGLIQVQSILKGIDGIDFIYLKKTDVVRHKLVKDIIQAFEDFEKGEKK
ncbi:PhoH family protein [candidate division KSB1 bacterium]|nr:MAG: PhoH family protein [candidate division KSB1 bacterium]